MTSLARSRIRRRWRVVALAIILSGAAAIVALPWLLGTMAARHQMARFANKILAPGSVEFGAIRLSWFRPTEIDDCVLRDAQGDRVVAATRATLSWSLWQILITHPKSTILSLEGSNVDIERSADGTVDLYETLKPVLSEHPRVQLVIRIENGRLRFRDPAFTDAVVADQANIVLDLGRGFGPIAWDLKLAQTQTQGPVSRIAVKGSYSRAAVGPSGQHDLTLALDGTRWPWTLAHPLVQVRGELTGKLDGQVCADRVQIDGDATVTNFVAIGDALSSDALHVETARARLALERNDGSWTIGKLDVTSPIVSLTGQGTIPPRPDKRAQLEATVNLAAVAHQLRATLHLRDDLRVASGTAHLRADIGLAEDGRTEEWTVTGKVADLAAKLGEKSLSLPEPPTLVAKLERQNNSAKLQRLEIQSSFLRATGQGDLDQGIVVTATLDLATFHERFRDWIELGDVELAGKGTLRATYRRQGNDYLATVGAAFRDLRLAGLPVVENLEREQVSFDGKVAGAATPAGWPKAWREVSVHGSTGETNVKLSARAGASADAFVVTGHAATALFLANRPHRLEAELTAKSADGAWTADRLALSLFRASKRGPGVAADEAICWEGNGRYDPARDELFVASVAAPPRPPTEHETWITGTQELRARGLKSLGAAEMNIAATADLSSLGRWVSPKDPPWGGRMDALLEAVRQDELWNLGLRFELRDAERSGRDGSKTGLRGSVVLTANGGYDRRSDRLQLTELVIKSHYLTVDGAGTVDHLTGRANVDLKGSLNPDWASIQALLAEKVEPNARIAGRPRAWRLTGTTDGVPAFDRMGSLEGEIGVQIDSLDVFGMRLSAVPVVLRSARGRLTVDPIDSKLNSGILHLEPELVRGEDDSTWLHLGRESGLDGAIVNDEVSHRVLSFAAPVLDGATRVEGRVSLVLADAYFPVVGPSGAQARIEGDMLFDDVRFMPGPLADDLLSVFQRERRPLAVLRDPIAVRIAGRKVYQEGLVIPVGKVASIGVNGSVDFDQNLDLIARFALTPPTSAVPVLSSIMEIAKFDVPIRGTLKKPKIDGEALKEHWKAIGVDLLGDSMKAGVGGLQRLLEGMRVRGLRGLVRPGRRAAPPAPPRPAEPDPLDDETPGDVEVPRVNRQALKPPAAAAEKPARLTGEQRKKLRQERRKERLQKKADRRAKKEAD